MSLRFLYFVRELSHISFPIRSSISPLPICCFSFFSVQVYHNWQTITMESCISTPSSHASGSEKSTASSLDFHHHLLHSREPSSSCSSSTSASFSSEGESEEETNSTESSSTSLESLANFIHTNLKPNNNLGKYDAYATSYITTPIPRLGFFSDDSASFSGDPPPFHPQEAVKIKEFQVREKRRAELGQSSRHELLIPKSKPILKEIHRIIDSKEISSDEGRRLLFFRARQWCEVNKALYVDSKYPKITASIFRHKHSEEHQRACQQAKKKAGLSDKTRIYKPVAIHPFPIPLNLVTNVEKLPQLEEPKDNVAGVEMKMKFKVEEEEKVQAGLRKQLHGIFDDIKPIPGSTVTQEDAPWQFKARSTGATKPLKVSKPSFRRTVYPPITQREKIVQLRKLLPPPKPYDMETDHLSGIWEPQLEIDEFTITPPNFDITRGHEDKGGVVDIGWFEMQEAKDKCKKWLLSIPDELL